MPKSHRAFTLLEMLVTLTIVAALAAVVAPMLSDDSRLRVMAAAEVITSDLELAQVMTIAHPDAPVVMKFTPDLATYWLAYAATPDTPLSREDNGQPYVVTLGADRARGAAGVTITLDQAPGDTIAFAAHGGLTDFTLAPTIRLARVKRGIQLAIGPNTGSITQSEFTPAKTDVLVK